jgi:hypothetical protein
MDCSWDGSLSGDGPIETTSPGLWFFWLVFGPGENVRILGPGLVNVPIELACERKLCLGVSALRQGLFPRLQIE